MIEEFKEGGRYLVSDNYTESLTELKVLEVSEKAIKIKFENGNKWYLKDRFPYKFIEELPIVKQTIEDRSHEIQFDDDWYEKDEPQFTLKLTEENDIDVKLKSEKNSKLEWQSNPPKNCMTWHEATEYAKTLGEGWRLPTRVELVDAYDNNVQGFLLDYNWSSTTYSRNTNNAWCVNLYDGHVSNGSKTYGSYVRCIREVK